MTTPNTSADLIAKITAVDASDFPSGKVYAEGEDAPGGTIAEVGTWVKFATEEADDYDYDGAIRTHTFQVKRRADPTQDPKAASARAAMIRLYDALYKIGAWTGASGAKYLDVWCATFPRVLEEQYVVMDVCVQFDTPSSV